MKEHSKEQIQKVINEWKSQTRYTWELKKLHVYNNPTRKGEVILYVSNSVDCFFKDGKLINTSLWSPQFLTTTLSDSPIPDNPNADAYRLKDFLQKFDEEFYRSIEDKISGDDTFTSDPLFW